VTNVSSTTYQNNLKAITTRNIVKEINIFELPLLHAHTTA